MREYPLAQALLAEARSGLKSWIACVLHSRGSACTLALSVRDWRRSTTGKPRLCPVGSVLRAGDKP